MHCDGQCRPCAAPADPTPPLLLPPRRPGPLVQFDASCPAPRLFCPLLLPYSPASFPLLHRCTAATAAPAARAGAAPTHPMISLIGDNCQRPPLARTLFSSVLSQTFSSPPSVDRLFASTCLLPAASRWQLVTTCGWLAPGVARRGRASAMVFGTLHCSPAAGRCVWDKAATAEGLGTETLARLWSNHCCGTLPSGHKHSCLARQTRHSCVLFMHTEQK